MKGEMGKVGKRLKWREKYRQTGRKEGQTT